MIVLDKLAWKIIPSGKSICSPRRVRIFLQRKWGVKFLFTLNACNCLLHAALHLQLYKNKKLCECSSTMLVQ